MSRFIQLTTGKQEYLVNISHIIAVREVEGGRCEVLLNTIPGHNLPAIIPNGPYGSIVEEIKKHMP